MQSITPEGSLLLRRRRSKSLTLNKRVKEIKLEVSKNNSDSDVDESFKKDVNFNDWLSLQKRAASKRPTLALSPSFLLSPICFTPLHTPEGIVSPFCHLEKQITVQPDQETATSKVSSAPVSTNSNVFTFERNVEIPSQENKRRLCPIPEDRTLSNLDILYCSNQLNERFLIKHEASFEPPMSPSFMIASSSKRRVRMKNGSKQIFRPAKQKPNNVASPPDSKDDKEEKQSSSRRFSGNSENGKRSSLTRTKSSISKNGAFSSMIGF